MNYYHRHLGDYARDTGKLSMLEHGAYNLLLDSYYVTERGLPADEVYRIAKAVTKAEKAATNFVLKSFFKLVRGVWIKERCEQEIEAGRKRIAQAVENGRKGGRPKNPAGTRRDTGWEPTGFDSANPVESSPISNLQSPILRKESEAKNGLSETKNRSAELRAAVASITGSHRVPRA